MFQMHVVEDDRRRLAERLHAVEANRHSLVSEKLAQLEAQLAAKDAQIHAQAAR